MTSMTNSNSFLPPQSIIMLSNLTHRDGGNYLSQHLLTTTTFSSRPISTSSRRNSFSSCPLTRPSLNYPTKTVKLLISVPPLPPPKWREFTEISGPSTSRSLTCITGHLWWWFHHYSISCAHRAQSDPPSIIWADLLSHISSINFVSSFSP